MDTLLLLADLVLHVDQHLRSFVDLHGAWVYGLLFLIVFVETGLVVMPFLPGDSLLFVAGTLCGAGLMSLPVALVVLLAAAISGDQVNYSIGRAIGPQVFRWDNSRWFNRRAFEQAHDFYERHGGITIVLGRFMPFIRTFVPFVAGVAEMSRGRFTGFNVVGALIWVVGVTTVGYIFGDIPFVQKNLSLIIWGMILIPGVFALYGAWKARRQSKADAA